MELKDIQKNEESKTVRMNIRTSKKVGDFMTKRNISPQKFFDESMKRFMDKETKNEKD